MKTNIHPTDPQWEEIVRHHYGKAYPELETVFQHILGRAFMKTYWIPEPIAMDYLCKIMIRFLPVTFGKDLIEEGLSLCTVDSSTPQHTVRFYESVGEMILWWTGMYHERSYQFHGRQMFTKAYGCLQDLEASPDLGIILPGQEESDEASPRLRINKLFSEQFDHFVDVMAQSNIIHDPVYTQYRDEFKDDDISMN